MGRQRILCVVAVVAALVAATPVMAQRLSLAERVTQLENQANVDAQGAGNANLEAQNRLVQLQSEISSLRNSIETLQNQLEQLKEQSRQQAIDADGRLTALEGGTASAPAATPPRRDHATVGEPADAARESAAAGSGFADVDPPPADEPADAALDMPADPAAEEATYQAALDTLVERFEAADSARLFQAFIRDYPDSPLLPNAYYWLGESYYVTQNYELAVEAFSTLLRNYRDSRKEPDALLKLGYCQIALDDRDRGELTLRELVNRHPGTDAAAKAESRLRTLAIENR